MNHAASRHVGSLFVLTALFLVLAVPSAGGTDRIAVVTDVGGRGDLSFNDMAIKGAEEAAREFDLEVKVVQPSSASDYLPNLQTLARSGRYEILVAPGFLLKDAVKQTAQQFPNQKFAMIDSVVKQPNVLNLLFKEQENSAVVGALAAMLAAHYGYDNVGMVLGVEIPVLWRFEAGYRFGIQWGLDYYATVTGNRPDVGLLWTYTGTFSDVAKGKSAAQAQIQQGAVAVYNVAGPLGTGILEAVKEKLNQEGKSAGPPFMIGVDANQDYLGGGNKVIASGMKRVDRAAYTAVKRAVQGNFEGGTEVLGLANRGVAMSRYSELESFIRFGLRAGAIKQEDVESIKRNWLNMREDVPQFIWTGVNELENLIVSGEITPPAPSSEKEIKRVRNRFP